MTAAGAFEEVRQGLAKLLADLPRQPSALRVQAADVMIELTWELTAPAAGPTARQDGQPQDCPPRGGQPEDGLQYIVAPTVGVFYRAAEPGAAPFVDVGSVVRPGDQVAILEAMKLFLPIEADERGRVAAVLVENGHSVEYGEPLIALEPVEE